MITTPLPRRRFGFLIKSQLNCPPKKRAVSITAAAVQPVFTSNQISLTSCSEAVARKIKNIGGGGGSPEKRPNKGAETSAKFFPTNNKGGGVLAYRHSSKGFFCACLTVGNCCNFLLLTPRAALGSTLGSDKHANLKCF